MVELFILTLHQGKDDRRGARSQKTETASKQYVEHRIQKLVDFQETLGKHIDRRLQDVERVASRSTEDQKLRDQLLYDSLDHSAKISLLEARLHQRCGPDELVERVKYVEVHSLKA